jgi:16S rRNA (guanine966-N2)-methyltransferase
VLLVESGRPAVATIRANVEAIGLPGAVVVADRAERVIAAGPDTRYDVVFADPPYAVPDAEISMLLAGLAAQGWLGPDALVVVERSTRSGQLNWPAGYRPERSRRYGEATFWYGLAPEAGALVDE